MNGCEFARVVTKAGEECFLLTKLKNEGQEGFDLTLCHNGRVWTGTVTDEDLDTLCSRLKMEYSKYVKQTVDALTAMDHKETFQYQLNMHKDAVEFVWKKHVPGDEIIFQLGSVSLKSRSDSAELIRQIFNHCIEGMAELKNRIHRLETDNQRLSQERLNALKRLEKCVVAKEEIENGLYTKFALVLNSKKEKIRQLKQGEGENVGIGKRARSPKLEENNSLSKSAEDSGTDDERPAKKPAVGSRRSPCVPDPEDSLVLGEEGEGVTAVARPHRQRGRPQKKQTPSKPVLPRIGSNESNPGSARKSSLRKGGSNSSSLRSSENVDEDNLIDQL
ncbi:DNA repair protein XRCC4-like [Dreissena polymorpha]|nr:DNA repair protein XRCC4-like [Dreissena polymorpha]XP_052218152.1 DNA repair protein XRCC4-like [Dreissena polymorpha]